MPHPPWNWQHPDWPAFRFPAGTLAAEEASFLQQAASFSGALRILEAEDQQQTTVQIMGEEAWQSFAIEGETLDRQSVQSSLRRVLGLQEAHAPRPPREEGAAALMLETYRQSGTPLDAPTLFAWHRLLMRTRPEVLNAGRYRTGSDPMQIVSGAFHAPKIHYEAPPSSTVPAEMERFLAWLHASGPGGASPLPILTRAAMAHLHFVSIHPFEDGNGRLARAMVLKLVGEGLQRPTLLALSQEINSRRPAYYQALQESSGGMEIEGWLHYFGATMLAAQARTQLLLDFAVRRLAWLRRFAPLLNERQLKVVKRVLAAGPEGFTGGLSAQKYLRLTGASRATATRDLLHLVRLGALRREGARKGTRYYPLLEPGPA